MTTSQKRLRRIGPASFALLLAGLAAGVAQAGSPTRSLSAAWAAPPASASVSAPSEPVAQAQRSSLELQAGWAQDDGARMAGLTIRLDDGWKTYWRIPGDAGIPPAFDWSGSENVASVEVLWPRPVAFDLFGMTTLGYKREVTLPLKVTPRDPGRPSALRLSLAYGVCADICMPEMAEVALEVAPDAAPEGRAAIERSLAALPEPAAASGASLEDCRLSGEDGARRLEAELRLPRPPRGPLLAIVEAPQPMWFEPARLHAADGGARLTARLDPASHAGWLDRAALRVTVLGADRALTFEGCRG